MSKLNSVRKVCGVFLLWAAAAVALPAQTFTVVHSFNASDGAGPNAGLVQATDGKLYGTASEGGTTGNGTVFAITPGGVLYTLHSFDRMEGSGSIAGLVQGSDGNFYGVNQYGGHGSGTVFRITPSGAVTILYSFCPQHPCKDGSHPTAALVQGADGNFYGTTASGGLADAGTVFKITPNGTLTTLHRFDETDGGGPYGGLIQGWDGNLYGTTVGGGPTYSGTVFKITTSGVLTTLHFFDGTDGSESFAALVQGTDGDFYGTTAYGGMGLGIGNGTVFKITRNGVLTTLHEFDGTDGFTPGASLVQGSDGNFYGTTVFGGQGSEQGTVFEITPKGLLTTLHGFCQDSECVDGQNPEGALIQDTNGTFYGTTILGGTGGPTCAINGCGTVFSLSVGLGPFVETQPTSRNVGAGVKILGNNLTGATSVTFNGTPATFSVPRNTLIRATVPDGTATGTVQVVTPKGTLSSNVPFRVQQ